MPRADFYLIAKERFRTEPLLLVCELAKRGFAANLPILVLARDAAQAEALDDLLWSFDPDEYLPHQIAELDEGDDDTPILIATPDMDLPMRPLLINLRDAAPAGGFDRVLEASRWLRDHYATVRVVSGALLVAVGLLLFFDRFWWLNVGISRARDFVGLG